MSSVISSQALKENKLSPKATERKSVKEAKPGWQVSAACSGSDHAPPFSRPPSGRNCLGGQLAEQVMAEAMQVQLRPTIP